LLEVKNVIHKSRMTQLTPVVNDILHNDDPAKISQLLVKLNEI